MSEIDPKEPTRPTGDETPPATFKNSLRQWQAHWQAQRGTAPATTNAPSRPAKVRPRRVRRAARPR